MTALATADLEGLSRLGWGLADVAQSLADTERACDRAGRAAWRWRGPAAQQFDAELAATGRAGRRLRPGYEDVAAAVRSYARAVEVSVDLLRQADSLGRQAAALSAAAPLIGPDPGEGLRRQAAALHARAVQEHEAAAVRAAAQVRAATAELPAPRRTTGWERFTSDLAGGLMEQVGGLVSLGVAAVGTARGDASAREEVWNAVAGSWRVWEPLQQAWRDAREGRSGLAAAGVGGFLASGGKGRPRPGRLVTDLEVAHGEALQAARWRGLQESLGVASGQAALGEIDARLFVQEAMGGHAVREHVAKSPEYLRWRTASYSLASSFPDALTAQWCLESAMARHRGDLRQFLRDAHEKSIDFTIESDRPVGYGYRAGDARPWTATAYRVVVFRRGRSLELRTMYPVPP